VSPETVFAQPSYCSGLKKHPQTSALEINGAGEETSSAGDQIIHVYLVAMLISFISDASREMQSMNAGTYLSDRLAPSS